MGKRGAQTDVGPVFRHNCVPGTHSVSHVAVFVLFSVADGLDLTSLVCKVQDDEDFVVSDGHDSATSSASSKGSQDAGVRSEQVGVQQTTV